MITEEALQLLQTTAVDAAHLRVSPIPGDPRNVLVSSATEYDVRPIPPADRKHTVNALPDLVALAVDNPGKQSRSIWHSSRAVVLLFDHDDRRDTATMPLERTTVFAWLEEIGKGVKVDQRTFVSLLKTKLADAISLQDATTFLAVLKRITFKRTATTDSDLEKGREALGRSIEDQCSGADQLPDELTVTTPVYRNVEGLTAATVKLFVSVDHEEQRFTLTPIGDAVPLAVDGTQQQLGEHLAEEVTGAATVIHGTP